MQDAAIAIGAVYADAAATQPAFAHIEAYVMAHELVHLRHRSHGLGFWEMLRSLSPDCEKPKVWLERHQSTLSSAFLA